MCYYYDISSISTDPISIIFNRQISGLQTNDIANISSSSSSYWYWNGENYGFHKQLTADDVVKYISTSNTGNRIYVFVPNDITTINLFSWTNENGGKALIGEWPGSEMSKYINAQ